MLGRLGRTLLACSHHVQDLLTCQVHKSPWVLVDELSVTRVRVLEVFNTVVGHVLLTLFTVVSVEFTLEHIVVHTTCGHVLKL